MDIGQRIRDRLLELVDEKYRLFSSSQTPGEDHILGVRLPELHKLAAEIVKEDWRAYLQDTGADTHEELMLKGMIIGLLKEDIEEILILAREFIPLIRNWAVCDIFCSGLKLTRKHKVRVWEFLQPYLQSDREYEIRFGVVMLMNYYVEEAFAPLAFAHFDRIRHEGYYVKMAVAWAISVYYVVLPEETMDYLKHNSLENFTYHKALQKIIESRRVNQETKELIRSMRRKNYGGSI